MAHHIGTIEVKRTRDHMVIYGFGKTATGQKYIRVTEALAAKRVGDPSFKQELAAGIKKIMPDSPPLD